jgi:hypothetical protein
MIYMKGRRYLSIAGLILLTGAATKSTAQDQYDALRYSFLMPQGTARSMGFGSALGSIGGDFTSLSVNPAGIGVYRKSELMFTPSLHFNNVNGTYLDNTTDESNTRFNFSNVGIVFTKTASGKRYERSNWKAVSYGIGINRVADFNRHYSYGGLMKGVGSDYSSFSEIFVADANSYPNNLNTDGTLANMGYGSYLVNEDSLGFFTLANWETGLNQLKSVEEKGGISEFIPLSIGGNYQEKLMIGLTVGLPILRYERNAIFDESDATGLDNNYFDNFRYKESLSTSGIGANVKLGMIFKPSDYFRLGVAFHSPTWYSLSDVYNNSLSANTEAYKLTLNPLPVDLSPTTIIEAPENRFDYSLTTPWRGILSATVLMGQYGFVTADYEYVDYGSIRYNFSGEFTADEGVRNQEIKKTFTVASNFRVGVEGRLDNFLVRAGFGYYGNPYKASGMGDNQLNFSLGLGYRSDRFFTDISFVHMTSDIKETPYTLPGINVPSASIENRLNSIAWTIGFKM